MEINAFLDLFSKVSAKYGIENMDLNEDGAISEDELVALMNSEQDEEVETDLSTEDLSDIGSESEGESETSTPGDKLSTQDKVDLLVYFINIFLGNKSSLSSDLISKLKDMSGTTDLSSDQIAEIINDLKDSET